MAEATFVSITLTCDQALVLFEWLVREGNKDALRTAHEAEDKVLWNIEAQLEKGLVDPLRPNYAELLDAARERVARSESDRMLGTTNSSE
jgi:hypothetical protein